MTKKKSKRLKISYWKSIFLLSAFISLLPVNGFAQNTVSLNLENVSLTEFFKAIEQKSNIRFSYLNQDIDTQKDITISTKDENIESLLQKVLQKKGYSYQRTGNTIAILKTASKPTKTLKKITGLVTDEKGDPIFVFHFR
jgi:type II secretory pathway component GspD/PulD (secretin)